MTDRSLPAVFLAAAIVAMSLSGAAYAHLTVLHVFAGSDGANPGASLIEDTAGNLYGTTVDGGIDCSGYGCGTVFKLAPDGTETVLYAFPGGVYGMAPVAGLIQDRAGNFYGTTQNGGTGCDAGGCGIVFKLTADGTETVLHDFAGGSDGAYPNGVLVQDKASNLYGTTANGGSIYSLGCGTVFKIAPDGSETLLHVFGNGDDGCYPGYLIKDKVGNLYGTTESGGTCPYSDCGTVFKLAPDGTETVLYDFKGGSDGASPGGIIQDKAGNLYGATYSGGGTGCQAGLGCGTVFRLAPDGTESVLHAFTGGSDGAYPSAGLIEDGAGNLYGTTRQGGADNIGTVFKLAAGGTETDLYSFTGRRGAYPSSGLIRDKTGYLYGTTANGGGTGCGGEGCGVVFRIRK